MKNLLVWMIIGLGWPALGFAQVPAAVVTNSIYLDVYGGIDVVNHTPGSLTESMSGASVTDFATLSGGDAMATVTLSDPSAIPGGAGGNADVTFSYEIVGPSNVSVPLDFAVTFSAVVTGDAGADIFLNTGSNVTLGCAGILCTGSYVGTPSSFHGTLQQTVIANHVMTAEFAAECGVGTLHAGSCTASFDPTILFDPSFRLSGYALLISPDLTPVVAVPEPASIQLMLAGLVALTARFARRLSK